MAQEVVLAARPQGEPKVSDFEVREAVDTAPGEGEVLVRNVFVSVDPYMRSRMAGMRTYVGPYEIGGPIDGGAVGRVVESRHEGFAQGDWVMSMLGWCEQGIAAGCGSSTPRSRRLRPPSVCSVCRVSLPGSVSSTSAR